MDSSATAGCRVGDEVNAHDLPFFFYIAPDGEAWRTNTQPQPEGALRFVCISDTHTREPEIRIPRGDVLIHCGDALYRDANKDGASGDLAHLNAWMAKQPCHRRLFVAGNHEACLQTLGHEQARKALEGCTYLEDEEHEIEGVRIYASPLSLPYVKGGRTRNCAFQCAPELDERTDDFKGPIDERIRKIPDDNIDVLVTHGPPKGKLDKPFGEEIGSPALAERVKLVKPKYHIFGHIHLGYAENPLRVMVEDGTVFINACSVQDFEQPHQKGTVLEPIVFDVRSGRSTDV
eukprot:TRINITY_DN53900_c0_g1_i1.p1 TRINITY_DN53900_c0_g1~~TRINITY_DN53900_c0_g1_i1.p1  ORF type:complete len:290 (-),score=41.20 TRINITY_DN53900_c0_g1_i1:35-904(-)